MERRGGFGVSWWGVGGLGWSNWWSTNNTTESEKHIEHPFVSRTTRTPRFSVDVFFSGSSGSRVHFSADRMYSITTKPHYKDDNPIATLWLARVHELNSLKILKRIRLLKGSLPSRCCVSNTLFTYICGTGNFSLGDWVLLFILESSVKVLDLLINVRFWEIHLSTLTSPSERALGLINKHNGTEKLMFLYRLKMFWHEFKTRHPKLNMIMSKTKSKVIRLNWVDLEEVNEIK